MPLSFPPDNYGIVTGVQTVPTGDAGAGTVTIDAANLSLVVGTGTDFTGVEKGHYIYLNGAAELREILAVTEDTLLLAYPVTAVVGDTYRLIAPLYRKVEMVDLLTANNSTFTDATGTAAQLFPDPPNGIVLENQGGVPVVKLTGNGTGIGVTVTL